MKHVMIWLVRLYRRFISPIKPQTCRFTPSCSTYALEAFEKRGFFAGFILTTWRILRCNPFCKGGYDPVPEKGFRRVKTSDGNITATESENDADNDSEAVNNAADSENKPDEADIIEATPDETSAPRHKEKEN